MRHYKIGDKVKYNGFVEEIVIVELTANGLDLLITCSAGHTSNSFCNSYLMDIPFDSRFQDKKHKDTFKKKYKLTTKTFPNDKWYQWAPSKSCKLLEPIEEIIIQIRKEIKNETKI